MGQDEIIFLVEESLDGGFEAKALGHSIYSEAETLDELKEEVRDAVRCHFEEADLPRVIRLHLVRDETLAV
ncbi:MAG: 2-oxoisovalerate dehydrogenase [Rubrobacteraceae bacterium]